MCCYQLASRLHSHYRLSLPLLLYYCHSRHYGHSNLPTIPTVIPTAGRNLKIPPSRTVPIARILDPSLSFRVTVGGWRQTCQPSPPSSLLLLLLSPLLSFQLANLPTVIPTAGRNLKTPPSRTVPIARILDPSLSFRVTVGIIQDDSEGVPGGLVRDGCVEDGGLGSGE